MSASESKENLLQLTSQIVAAHVQSNKLPAEEVPALITTVYQTLSNIEAGTDLSAGKVAPAVPIRKSVTPDYLVCLEDGKKLKMLKRHLKTSYNLSPEEYRNRWGLPSDYPMVAPNYAKQRSALAREIGLGTRGKD
jgi:predicted transcriptional regulator